MRINNTSCMEMRSFCACALPNKTFEYFNTFASVANASEKCSPSADKETVNFDLLAPTHYGDVPAVTFEQSFHVRSQAHDRLKLTITAVYH